MQITQITVFFPLSKRRCIIRVNKFIKLQMKQIVLFVCFFISTIFVGASCNAPTDTPQYTYDQVLEVAQNISPYCRIQTVSGGGSG